MVEKSNKIGLFTLVLMNIAAMVSLRALSSESVYGTSSVLFYVLSAITFLVPIAIVSSELAVLFKDKEGGVFTWVSNAMGNRMGFLAIWLQWIQNTIWYPTILTFSAVIIAFMGMNQSIDTSIASNKTYMVITVLITYWIATFIATNGTNWVGKITKIGVMIGTIIPSGALIIFAIVYLLSSGNIEMDLSNHFLPEFTTIDTFVLASTILLFFSGIEMMGVHITEIKNPQKNYPKAILIASVIAFIIYLSGTLSLGVIIPKNETNLTQSLLIGFNRYINHFGVGFLSPLVSISLLLGALSGLLIWIYGPSKGILHVAKKGFLPPFFQKTNAIGVQENILIVQGIIVSALTLLFIMMPSIQSFYQILTQLTVILYLIMYLLLFGSVLILRYKLPIENREDKKVVSTKILWILSLTGASSCLFAMTMAFIPPQQIYFESNSMWDGILIVGMLLFICAPFIIYQIRRESWADQNKL